jgi:hypothetical protein
MFRRCLISVILLFSFTTLAYNQVVSEDEKLRETIEKFGQAEVTIPYSGIEEAAVISEKVSITSVRDKKIYITISPATAGWFISQGFKYTLIEPKGQRGLFTSTSVEQAMEWGSYPSWTQYLAIMQDFQSSYPSLCRLDTIGTSINGRLVLALKISDNVNADEPEPEVFYSSTIHGDELAGYVLMLRLVDYLLSNYTSDPEVKNLVDNLEIWINPLANPDGTYTNGDTIAYPVRSNADGIDLNRNFPDPLDPNITQEKETSDMIKFMRKHKFVISANFHSGSEVVNYPWDRWLSKYHADDAWFYKISRAYADTVHLYSGPSYMNELDNGVTRGAVWYIIYGGRQDFITWELQGREVTIELDLTKQTPAAQLELLWNYNMHSLLQYLGNALYGIHGYVYDADTGEPVPAKIFINGHDKDSSHVYSDTLTGRFTRYLVPGTWNIKFSASGYKDTIVSNVTVIDQERTDLIVDMNSLSGEIVKTSNRPFLFPNPTVNIIKCLLPDTISGRVNIKIYNQSGKLVSEFNRDVVPKEIFNIDLGKFAAGTYFVKFTNKVKGITYSSKCVVTGRF